MIGLYLHNWESDVFFLRNGFPVREVSFRILGLAFDDVVREVRGREELEIVEGFPEGVDRWCVDERRIDDFFGYDDVCSFLEGFHDRYCFEVGVGRDECFRGSFLFV